MKNIAFLMSGDPNNMKGFMNNVQERARRLASLDNDNQGLVFDFFMIRHRDSWIFSMIRQKKRPSKKNFLYIDTVKYRNIWLRHTLVDYLLTYKLKARDIADRQNIIKCIKLFSEYDLIMGHGESVNYLAYRIYEKYNIPYMTSWHGSDINVRPFINKRYFQTNKKIIENAYVNLFVSKRLKKTSDKITKEGNKQVLYTGPSEKFYAYEKHEIIKLRKRYRVEKRKVVAFIGNIVPIKNIQSLPEIFMKIFAMNESVIFWIIGDGSLESQLSDRLNDKNLPFKMHGKVLPDRMPELMNCIDVLILPSLNEGLPRVVLEARTSGVNVVGSDAGGIPEVISKENVFPLNKDFESNVAERVNEILVNNQKSTPLPDIFSWEKTMKKILYLIKID